MVRRIASESTVVSLSPLFWKHVPKGAAWKRVYWWFIFSVCFLQRTNDDQPPPSKRSEWGESEIGTKRRSIEDLIVELSKQ